MNYFTKVDVRSSAFFSPDYESALNFAKSTLLDFIANSKIVKDLAYFLIEDKVGKTSFIIIFEESSLIEKLKRINLSDIFIRVVCIANTLGIKLESPVAELCILLPPISNDVVYMISQLSISDGLVLAITDQKVRDFFENLETLEKTDRKFLQNTEVLTFDVYLDDLIKAFCEVVALKYFNNLAGQLVTLSFINEVLKEKKVHEMLSFKIL